MCQLSGISKAGTEQNSTSIVDYCFFSTRSSFESIAKSRTCGFERQDFVFFCDSIFSAFFPMVFFFFCMWCGVITPCNQEYSHEEQWKGQYFLLHDFQALKKGELGLMVYIEHREIK